MFNITYWGLSMTFMKWKWSRKDAWPILLDSLITKRLIYLQFDWITKTSFVPTSILNFSKKIIEIKFRFSMCYLFPRLKIYFDLNFFERTLAPSTLKIGSTFVYRFSSLAYWQSLTRHSTGITRTNRSIV